ncbi:MAG: MFS transporter [Armatimonadetes bacterium]|nr:MFS transporter [Armatimonadota bacterium]MDE2206158.1 MFS transporter [Armatimonadota bacterium]
MMRLGGDRRYRWMVVAMLWLICVLNYADRQALFAIYPLLESRYGFSKSSLGLISLAFMWVYALSAPLAGVVVDRVARKPVILLGLAIWSAITGATASCRLVWQFVVVRGAEALGETFYFPASMSMLADYHPTSTRSRAMGIHQTGVYAGTVLGGGLAGWMALHYGWRSPFLLLMFAGGILSILLARMLLEPVRASRAAPAESRWEETAQSEPATLLPLAAALLAAAFFGANLVALIFLVWMPTFLHDKFHLNLAVAGIGAVLFLQVGSMFGSAFGGWIGDRYQMRHRGGRIAWQAVAALAGAPFIALAGLTRSVPVLVLALTLFGFFKGCYDANIWAGLFDVIRPGDRGAGVGLLNMIGWFGGGLGTVAVGFASDHGFPMSLSIVSAAVVYVLVGAILAAAARLAMRAWLAGVKPGR